MPCTAVTSGEFGAPKGMASSRLAANNRGTSKQGNMPMSPTSSHGFKQRGFTLIEAMTAVAILAILASIALPGMAQFLAARRVEDAARRIGEDLAFARNEAVKRNSPVLMCAGASGACEDAPATTDWATGWRVCYDPNADGACEATDAKDPNPMRTISAVTNTITVTGPTSRLSFNPNGTITSTNFTQFTVASTSATTSNWTVRIAASGAISVRRG